MKINKRVERSRYELDKQNAEKRETMKKNPPK